MEQQNDSAAAQYVERIEQIALGIKDKLSEDELKLLLLEQTLIYHDFINLFYSELQELKYRR